MRAAYLMAVAMMLPLVMHAAEDQHQHVHDLPVAGAAAATEAIIVVTVNPEVRGSAAPAGVALEFDRTPLSGVPEAMRSLRITLPTAATVDLAVAFRAP